MSVSGRPVLVVVEHEGGVLHRSTRRLLARPRHWSAHSCLMAISFGPGAEAAACASLKCGASDALWLTDAECAPLRWLRGLAEIAADVNAGCILFSDSVLGRDLAPRLAVRLNGAFVPGVVSTEQGSDGASVTRSLMGGRFLETLAWPGDTRLVMTWRGDGNEGEDVAGCVEPSTVRPLEVPLDERDLRVRIRATAADEGRDLGNADVVVCGGRGVGSREGFSLVYQLAEAVGGAPAASRAAVDAGYAPPELQIGQSGKSVSPRFYFALGISGSLQHRAGMQTSRCVIAVNTDPAAPILRWADYGVVGDLRKVVPELIGQLNV